MSGITYLLLAVALVGPFLTAVLLRYLRTRMTALPFYSIGGLLFGLSAGAVVWLALADIERVEIGGLTIAQNQGASLLLPPPNDGPNATVVLPTAPVLTAIPTPTSDATATATATTTATPRPTVRPTVTLAPTATAEPTATPEPPTNTPQPEPPSQRTYTVQPGDTLRSIAEQFGVTVQAIIDANGLTPEAADSLQPGDELIIP